MSAPEANLSPVQDDEQLARFVLYGRWVRADQTVRPDAFIPHPWPDLSVTRHVGLSQAELWRLGQDIADRRPATLYGRADVEAARVRMHSLQIVPTATPRNHANITNWPEEKSAQKSIAQELAAAAKYVSIPQT